MTPGAHPSSAAWPTQLYALSPGARVLTGAVLLSVCAGYFGWLWSGGRRTLAMRTWRLGLVTTQGRSVGVARALARFAACLAGLAVVVPVFALLEPSGHGRWAAVALALNYAWALVDSERAFLQDRIAGTRLIFRP